jgi:methionine-rich copper-binding protein CopC
MKLVVFVFVSLLLAGCTNSAQKPIEPATNPQNIASVREPVAEPSTPPSVLIEAPEPTFGTQTKSAHFVKSVPAHAEILERAPNAIVFTFNFDIDPSSTVSVKKDGVEFAKGLPSVGQDRLTLTQNVNSLEPGTYTVTYSACWPDKTCHPGQFQFAVSAL